MLEGRTALGFMAAHSQRARLGLHGRRRPLPPARAVGQGDDDARRPVRRPRLARASARPGTRTRAARPRLPVPAARRAVRAARGHPPDRPRDVAGRARQRGARSRAGTTRPTRLLNSPQSLSRPRVPIMIGGGGEQKTLRLVAQYADATTSSATGPRIAHKYAVLREHCERLGRDLRRDRAVDPPGRRRRARTAAAARRRRPQSSTASASWPTPVPSTSSSASAASTTPSRLELIGRDVIPQLRDL